MKFKMITLLLMCIFLITSCSDSSDSSSPTTPTDPSELDVDYSLVITSADMGKEMMAIVLLSRKKVESISAKINNVALPVTPEGFIETTDDDTGEKYWMTFGFASPEHNIESGKSCDYSVSFNGNSFTGNLMVMPSPEVNWPENFDYNSDFSFSWTLGAEPHSQDISLELDNGMISIDESWTIDKSKREYTIEKSKFSGADESSMMYVYLNCYNLKLDGKFAASSVSGAEYTKSKKLSREKLIQKAIRLMNR